MGLTKLYVPAERLFAIATPPTDEKSNLTETTNGLRVSKELRESEKAVIDRFETIVRYWIKQIRQVLASTSCTSKGERTVFDDVQRWRARC